MTETLTNEQMDKLMDWPPLIDHDLMYKIENDCQARSFGQHRRALLGALTMDSEKLFEACESGPEAFFEVFQCSATTLGNLKRLVHMLDIAHHRLMMGLCSVDTDSPDAPFSKHEFSNAINEARGEDDSDGETDN